MIMKNKTLFALILGFVIIAYAPSAFGMPILSGSSSDGLTWTATDGNRSAEAIFQYRSDGFDIYLSSLASSTSQPHEVLGGLFFGLNDGTASNPHVMAMGNVIIDTSRYAYDFGNNLDGEWAERSGINGINGGLGDYGISNTGFGEGPGAPSGWDGFGAKDIIDSTVAYTAPLSPNGAEFGIVSGDISGLVSSVSSYVEDGVLISYDFIGDFEIAQVNFLYGTEYSASAVPEPATMLLLGSGLFGFGVLRKKFKK